MLQAYIGKPNCPEQVFTKKGLPIGAVGIGKKERYKADERMKGVVRTNPR
jgi:hypothetical protein